MGAEKIVKINSEHEVEYLKERINLLESVIDYSLAETVQGLKNKVKDLENEAIALRAADAEKDKMITEKTNQIAEIKKNFNNQLNNKLEWQRRQFDAEKAQSLSDQRKNIRSKEVKPEKEKVEQAKKEVDRIQKMYDSLLKEHTKSHENEKAMLNEFNQSHENEKAILSICSEILSNIKQLISSGATSDELVEKIDFGIKSLEKKATKTKAELIAEDKKIIQMIDDGMSDSDIADIIYSHLDNPQTRRVQLSKRKATQRFKELVGN